MKTIFNKALWASAIGACTLSLGSCTDLSETIYDTIASEKYEFTEKDRAAMFAPVYSSLRDVYWGWYSYADMMDPVVRFMVYSLSDQYRLGRFVRVYAQTSVPFTDSPFQ